MDSNMSNSPINSDEESDVKVVVNPYNFNNKLITENDVKAILSKYEIDDNINGLEIYQQAFIHSSYSKKDPKEIGEDVVIAEKPEGALELFEYDYERLEFLGDAVVSMAIAKYLFERYPNENEGFLTKMRTKLVNGEMMATLSKKLGFAEFVIISRHIEDKCNGRDSISILEDVFEAFIGAMFLDFNEIDNYNLLDNFYCGIGYQVCEKFIIHMIEDLVDFSELIMINTNYKDQLNKYFSNTFQIQTTYKEISVEGPPNERIYKMCVLDQNGQLLAEGEGRSKKKAEQQAAKNSLIKLGIIL